MLHHLAGATIQVANLVNYNCRPLEDGDNVLQFEQFRPGTVNSVNWRRKTWQLSCHLLGCKFTQAHYDTNISPELSVKHFYLLLFELFSRSIQPNWTMLLKHLKDHPNVSGSSSATNFGEKLHLCFIAREN